MSIMLPAVTTAVGLLAGLRKRRRPNIGAINSRYMGMRPSGYLTPEDMAQAERVRSKGVGVARRSGELARGAASRTSAARGLSGASAAALATEANNTEAAGREAAYGAGTDAELGLFGQNRDFEREKMFKAWGGELGAASQEAGYAGQQEAGLWNSILGTAPLISNAWGTMGSGPSAGDLQTYASDRGGYYNPDVKPRF